MTGPSTKCALTIALVVVAAASCARPPAPSTLPVRLADTGLYSDFDRREIAGDVLTYSPVYPLWSDGTQKRRWIRLPLGTAIDGSDADAWQFPVGTRIWKEFAFDRRIETRFMELGGDGSWSFASYVWSTDERDAVLAPKGGLRGAWRSAGYRYDVPSQSDCRLCHDGGRGPVLGFGALQLSGDRDPLAPNAEVPPADAVDLAELAQRELVRGVREVAPRIAARTARERAVLGYLHANCGICHNDRGPLESLGLVLDARTDRAGIGPLTTGCDQPSRYCPPGGDPATSVRIRPGDPRNSVLLHRISSRDPMTQMPPLGTGLVDSAAIQLLAEWIREDLSQSPHAK